MEKESIAKSRQASVNICVPFEVTEDWQNILKEAFSPNITETEPDSDGMVCAGFFDGTKLFVSVDDSPQAVSSQVEGMRNYYLQAPVSDAELKKMILIQISAFRTVFMLSFQLDDDSNRTNAILAGVADFARRLKGFLAFPDGTLHHYSGRLLVSADGRSDYTQYYPEGDRVFVVDDSDRV